MEEVRLLGKLLESLGYRAKTAATQVDNQSLVAPLKGRKSSDRVQQIDIKFHWLKERMEDDCFTVQYCDDPQ